MTDDLFLKLCYFGMGVVSLLLGWAVYRLCRRSFTEVARNVAPVSSPRFIGRLFLLGIPLTSFAGFLAVSVPGCHNHRYEEIVSIRPYIVEKAIEQASSSMLYVVDGLLVFGLVIALLVSSKLRGETDGSSV